MYDNKLTNEEIAKVFKLYSDSAKVKLWLPNPIWQKEVHPEYDITGIDTSVIPFKINLKSSVGVSLWYSYKPSHTRDQVLLLMRLENIPDDNLVEVARVGKYLFDDDDEKDRQRIIDCFIKGDIFSFESYFLLIQKKYAVPLFFGKDHWANGKTAIELNIAIEK